MTELDRSPISCDTGAVALQTDPCTRLSYEFQQQARDAVRAGEYTQALNFARQAQCLDQSNTLVKQLAELLQEKVVLDHDSETGTSSEEDNGTAGRADGSDDGADSAFSSSSNSSSSSSSSSGDTSESDPLDASTSGSDGCVDNRHEASSAPPPSLLKEMTRPQDDASDSEDEGANIPRSAAALRMAPISEEQRQARALLRARLKADLEALKEAHARQALGDPLLDG